MRLTDLIPERFRNPSRTARGSFMGGKEGKGMERNGVGNARISKYRWAPGTVMRAIGDTTCL